MPGTIRSALRGERPIIRSDGRRKRDYLYVEDGAAAYLMLAEALAAQRDLAGQAFNFGHREPIAVLDLVERISEPATARISSLTSERSRSMRFPISTWMPLVRGTCSAGRQAWATRRDWHEQWRGTGSSWPRALRNEPGLPILRRARAYGCALAWIDTARKRAARVERARRSRARGIRCGWLSAAGARWRSLRKLYRLPSCSPIIHICHPGRTRCSGIRAHGGRDRPPPGTPAGLARGRDRRNDGYLQEYFQQEGMSVLGIDPARAACAAAAARGVPTRMAFFDRRFAESLVHAGTSARLVVANNVMAHVPDFQRRRRRHSEAARAGRRLRAGNPVLRDLLDRVEFDTIYHEHVFYYSLTALDALMKRHDLSIVDAERLPVHGGSLRVTAAARESARANESVDELLEEEAIGPPAGRVRRGSQEHDALGRARHRCRRARLGRGPESTEAGPLPARQLPIYPPIAS